MGYYLLSRKYAPSEIHGQAYNGGESLIFEKIYTEVGFLNGGNRDSIWLTGVSGQ